MTSHEIKKVVSDSVNIGAGPDLFVVRIEPTNVLYNVTNQNGTVSAVQILFNNVNLPSLSNSVIAKLARIRYTVTVTSDGTLLPVSQTGLLGPVGQQMCLSDFPLSRCTDSLSVTINSQTNTINLRQTLGLLKRTFPMEFIDQYATECPCMPDNAPALAVESLIFNAAGPPATALLGFQTSSQPLSNYYNTKCGVSRSSFQPIAVTATTVSYEICEAVLCSPFGIDDLAVPFSNFNTLSVQYSMSALGEMFTMGAVPGAGGTNYPPSYAVTLGRDAYLELVVSSVDNTLVQIPRTLATEYENVQYYLTAGQPITGLCGAGATAGQAANAPTLFTQASQTLRLQNMPDRILVGFRVAESYRVGLAAAGGTSFADGFFQWGNFSAGGAAGYSTAGTNGQQVISIQLNNRSGVGASMSTKELWRLSKKNGLKQSYQEWNECGGPAIFTPSDLGLSLDSGDLPVGLSGNVNLTINATFNNSNYINNRNQLGLIDWAGPTVAVQTELVIVVVFKGIAYITPDSMNLSTSYLTSNEVNMALRSSADAYIPAAAIDKAGGLGGAVFGSRTNVLHSSAGPVARRVKGGSGSGGSLSGAGMG